jgi:hypothetical protein
MRRRKRTEEEAENEAAAVAGRWPVKTVNGNDEEPNEITLKQERRVRMKEKGSICSIGHTVPCNTHRFYYTCSLNS